jgi:hypothetical protein
MKELWDKSMVRRLRAEVRKQCREDWAASRARGRAGPMAGLWHWMTVFFCSLIVVVIVDLPAMPFPETEIAGPATYGLLALTTLMAGFILGKVLVQVSTVETRSLACAPVDALFVYRFALGEERRSCARNMLFGLLFNVVCAAAAAGCWGTFSLATLPKIMAVGVLLTAVTSVLGIALDRLPMLLHRGVLLLFGFAGLVSAYNILRLKMTDLPPPVALGESMLWMPQAALFEWLANKPLSWIALATSLACVATARHRVRP